MKNKNVLVGISIIIITILFFVIYINYSSETLFSYDEFSYDIFSDNLINSGKICYENGLNEKFNTTLFITPFSVIENNCQYPQHSVFRIIYFTLFSKILIGQENFFLISALFGVISIFLIYILTYTLFKNKIISLISSIVLASFPLFIHWSTLLYLDTFGIFCFLLLSILLFSENNSKINVYLIGVLLAVIISLRYSDILLIIPIFLIFILIKTKKNILNLSYVIIIFIISILLINIVIYHNAIFIPDLMDETGLKAMNNNILGKIGNYISLNKDNLNALGNTTKYILNTILLFPLSIMLPLSFLYLKNYKKTKNYLLFLLSVFIILFLFYGRGNLGYGINRISFQSSIGRYLMPVFILLIPLISLAIYKIISLGPYFMKIIKVLLFVVIIISSVMHTYNFEDYGINNIEEQRSLIIEQRNFINKTIGIDSFSFVDGIGFSIFYPNINNKMFLSTINKPEIQEVGNILSQTEVYYVGGFYEGTDYKKNSDLILNYLRDDFEVELVGTHKDIRIYNITNKNEKQN